MRAQMTVIFVLALLAGCAPQSGNYAGISDAQNQQMAEDTAHKVAVLYPPASTHILLSQAANDAYGLALEKTFRESGYAVQHQEGFGDWVALLSPTPDKSSPSESNDSAVSAATTHRAAPVLPVTTGDTPVAEAINLPVSYVVDHLDGGLYRVSLTMDTRVMSRVYAASTKRFGAAGDWVLKE